MINETINAKAASASALTGAASFIFGVPVAVVLAAFAGACLSLSLSTKRKFLGSVVYVASGTTASAFCTPLALHIMPGMPDRATAFLLGLAIMFMLPQSVEVLSTLPKGLKNKWLSR